ncbi:protein-glutamate methylesterase/protein-glutamine glutaminase [Acutalibacter intestini]|uniref:protein-glutamate methylesterase/protein-glutamine glutaminase n=1 Tax=Acutalibacter intestini TaxID=3093659 RepID=UPI002AC89A97|nr:chemotaxis response regulator protein-glutamate methylesterase [Acutalibacter sp. M00204]
MQKKIRVLVVDDSIVARKLIMDGLARSPRIEVAGYAINARDAENKVKQLNPDVMTCDVQMPGMTGIEFLKKLLPEYPLPVVLASSLNLKVFDALHAGAVGFVRKPDDVQSREAFISSLTEAVIEASSAKVRRPAPAAKPELHELASVPAVAAPLGGLKHPYIVGLGASTGGTEATLEVMKRLPADIPPMVIVQHMPPGFTKMYAERLDRLCRMEVREAQNGDRLAPGLALVAPADLQCRINRTAAGEYYVSCTPGEKVSGHRPSVDALFLSMAENVRCKMIGIIMTGMGSDGAEGLLRMRQRGAYTIGQDKESCVVYGMPGVAYERGAVCEQASCERVASVLLRSLQTGK